MHEENNKKDMKMIEELFQNFSVEEIKGVTWVVRNMDLVRPFIERAELSNEQIAERMKMAVKKEDYVAFFILSYKQFYDNHMKTGNLSDS